jgi:KRAB domain-containing zinc finger protein
VCKKVFVSKGDLKEHHQRNHGEVRPFSCDVCNKMFAIRKDLEQHKIMHIEERPYYCDVCNMSFRNLSALKRHMFRHNNNYPFSCDLCCVMNVIFLENLVLF